jgi:hypothetical protein
MVGLKKASLRVRETSLFGLSFGPLLKGLSPITLRRGNAG